MEGFEGLNPWTFQSPRLREQSQYRGKISRVESYEDHESLHLICEVPGVGLDNIEVDSSNGILAIRVNKPSPCINPLQWWGKEICYGTEQRMFQIPSQFSNDPSACTCKDGVLYFIFPKQVEAKTKTITVA